jgi:hypothetical protein
VTINTERLTQYDALHLDRGAHHDFEDGHCAMEVVAWLAGEGHTDAPSCASPVLRRYTVALNDRWPDDRRQLLKPHLPRMVGTGNDGKDHLREQIASRFLVTDLLGPWLRLAAMGEQADALAALTAAPPAEIRAFLYKIRDEAWTRRRASMDQLRAKVREHLANRPAAAAAAVAAAVAAAAAAAAAVAAAATPSWKKYDVAYAAARQYFRDNPLAIGEKVQALAAEQQPLALALLEQLIDPQELSAEDHQ